MGGDAFRDNVGAHQNVRANLDRLFFDSTDTRSASERAFVTVLKQGTCLCSSYETKFGKVICTN